MFQLIWVNSGICLALLSKKLLPKRSNEIKNVKAAIGSTCFEVSLLAMA